MKPVSDLVTQVFTHLTFPDAVVAISDSDGGLNLTVTVDETSSGILIGYRGEKINALQLLLTLMINNDAIAYQPVHIDINGYREKRHQSVREMADSAAQNAIDSGREILLPPLPSFERRIVHLHLSQNPQVETYSEGEGDDRRLVVRPATA
jgi:spoIIIJ-associated protein